jgi:peptide/nickel transport system ATP-binding protein
VQRQILDMLRELQQRLSLSMVLVTHDISVVAYLCDDVVVMYAGQVIESGPVRDVLARPRHPYTMGLRNAFPDLLSDALELVPIHGSPPDLRDPPAGCRFAPRCPFAEAACKTDVIPLAGNGHQQHLSACRRDGEADLLRQAALDPATWQLSSGPFI